MITAILLASGYSQRLKRDKLSLDFNGIPVLEHTMRAISNVSFSKKLLVTRQEQYSCLASQYGFQTLLNPMAQTGQSSSIRLGVLQSDPSSAFMFFVGDQPLLSSSVIKRLLEVHRQKPGSIIIPTLDGQNQNPVIFPSSLRESLLEITGDTGGRSVIAKNPHLIQRVSFTNPLPFLDIDTSEDYFTLLSKAKKTEDY